MGLHLHTPRRKRFMIGVQHLMVGGSLYKAAARLDQQHLMIRISRATPRGRYRRDRRPLCAIPDL